MRLKDKWKEVCEEYLKAFCERHEYDFRDAYWIGDDFGGIADIGGDLCISIDTIRYDVDNNVDTTFFLSWYDYEMEVSSLDLPKHINFSSWCKGAPLPYSSADFQKIKVAREKVEEAKRLLDEEMKRLKKNDFQD